MAEPDEDDLGFTVPRKPSELRGYEVRRSGMGALEGFAGGLLGGAALGAIMGYADGNDPPCMSNELFGCLFYVRQTAAEKATIDGVLLGITGALTGTVIGALAGHTDRFLFY